MKDFLAEKVRSGGSVAVLGFGRAGRAAVDFFLARGARISVYARELPDAGVLAPYLERGVRFAAGDFPACFTEDLIVRSPVLRPDIPPLRASQAPVTDETQLCLALTPAHTVGVTGSDGKTTTSSLVAAMLTAGGKHTLLGGNNGVPLLPLIHALGHDDYAVLELSSFQLMGARQAPEIAVITNITPNHLDWHTDFAEYVAAKRRILQGALRAVLNVACADAIGFDPATFPPTAFFARDAGTAPSLRACDTFCYARDGALWMQGAAGEEFVLSLQDFRLAGQHNIENLAAAVSAVWGVVPLEAIEVAACEFRGVAHRLQYVDTVCGVHYYNSSIDTSPTRTAAALLALGGSPLVIVGGRGKGISLSPLGDALARHARAVFAYGDTRDEIARAVAGRVPLSAHNRFADAFAAAAAAAVRGDTVLLSPGCTAFGEFRDFEERGEVFCRLVRELAERKREVGTEGIDPQNGGADERHGL